jgi:AcrR family transcriptional regulator
VRVADDEGFGALSMRRLAAELGAGTMTLYHYVRTKDELLTLVTDWVMGEVVLGEDESLPPQWRDALTVLANRSRASMQRHPWILDISDDPAIGPNSVRHFDQTLEALSSLDTDLETKIDIAAMVDEYVFGHCLMERNNLQTDDQSGYIVDYVEALLATGSYPQLAAMAADIGVAAGWSRIDSRLRDPARFDRCLGLLLDGIEANLAAT